LINGQSLQYPRKAESADIQKENPNQLSKKSFKSQQSSISQLLFFFYPAESKPIQIQFF
jgi:hypothetical protein